MRAVAIVRSTLRFALTLLRPAPILAVAPVAGVRGLETRSGILKDRGEIRGLTLMSGVYAAFIFTFLAALLCAVPAALAVQRSVPATRSVTATVTIEGYDVDFTLPSNSKSGCLVCHADPNLSRLKDGKLVSFWIDPAVVDISSHSTVQCTGCHLDFAFKVPHVAIGGDWATGAKSACANCHLDQSALMSKGAHRAEPSTATAVAQAVAATPAKIPKPLCGDCHGNHEIMTITDSQEGQNGLRNRADGICKPCHEEYWENFNDYYHGAAFKRGAVDAPACWDCHEAHDPLPVGDKDSNVNERHLVETCKQCHPDANEDYVAYAQLVHKRQDVADRFFLYQWILAARTAVMRLFGT